MSEEVTQPGKTGDAREADTPPAATAEPPSHGTRPSEAMQRLKAAEGKAGWMVWAGLGLAVVWWAAALAAAFTLVTGAELASLPGTVVIAGVFMLLMPGLILLMAGFMAREHARAGAANAIVLESAARLLVPAEAAGRDAHLFAHQMKTSARDVDRAMGHALSSMQAMAGEIGAERQRLESVSYTSADNARELAERLQTERTALEELARDLRVQTREMSDALPRHAEEIVTSARTATEQISAAEDTLGARLEALDKSGEALAGKVTALDSLASDAEARNEKLLFAITRMEEKLEESRKTVDAAVRAGEMAAAAAGTTGDKLTEAVSASLEGARRASSEIRERTREATAEAERSLAALKAAGEQAASAIRSAGTAAQARIDDVQPVRETPVPEVAPVATPDLFTHAPAEPEPDVPDEDAADEAVAEEPGNDEADSETADEDAPPIPFMVYGGRDAEPEASASTGEASEPEDEAAADAPAERVDAAGESEPEPEAQSEPQPDPETEADSEAASEPEAPAPAPAPVEAPEPARPAAPARPQPGSERWTDIIAGLQREDGEPLPREQHADQTLAALRQAGIPLAEIFRPRDKKRIAMGARKGDRQRHNAVEDAAGRYVDEVSAMLQEDRELQGMAREFLAMEQPDALMALEKTWNSAKNASPRLTAFLLIETAMSRSA